MSSERARETPLVFKSVLVCFSRTSHVSLCPLTGANAVVLGPTSSAWPGQSHPAGSWHLRRVRVQLLASVSYSPAAGWS